MTSIANLFAKEKGWIIANLNPNRDMLQQLAAIMAQHEEIRTWLKSAKVSISIPGLSMQVQGEPAIKEPGIALRTMLKRASKSGISVLITIDEATNKPAITEFLTEYQIYMPITIVSIRED